MIVDKVGAVRDGRVGVVVDKVGTARDGLGVPHIIVPDTVEVNGVDAAGMVIVLVT